MKLYKYKIKKLYQSSRHIIETGIVVADSEDEALRKIGDFDRLICLEEAEDKIIINVFGDQWNI